MKFSTRRHLRLIILLLILLSVQITRAHEAKDCEVDALSTAEAVRRAIGVCLEQGELKVEEVRKMISHPGQLSDPFSSRHKDIKNLDLRKKVARLVGKLLPEHISHAQKLLADLLEDKAADQVRTKSAQENTAVVFAPRLVHSFPLPAGHTDIPVWHTTKNGELQLVQLSGHNAHLRIYTPKKTTPLIDKELRPGSHIPGQTFGSVLHFKTNDGRLLLAHFYFSTNRILISEVEGGRVEITDLPFPIHDAALVGGKNGMTSLVVRMSGVVAIYNVGANLKLHEVRRKSFDAQAMDVASSKDGQIKIALSNPNRQVMVFDPFSSEVPQIHQAQSEVQVLRGIFSPKGQYALAIRTQAHDDANFQYEFLTSETTEPFLTTTFSPKTWAGEWFVTKDGNTLFPIGVTFDGEGYYLYIYDPLHPKKDLEGLRSTLAPLYKMDGGMDSGTTRPLLFESPDGHLHLIEGAGHSNDIRLRLFDPGSQFKPIREISLMGNAEVRIVKAGLFTDSKQIYYLVLRHGSPSFGIHLGMESGASVLDGISDAITPAVQDKDGHWYIAGVSYAHPHPHRLQIYRLTTKNGEPSYE